MSVTVQREQFDIGQETNALVTGRPEIGGVASFTGYVRDFSAESGVVAMTLEHYPGMTERMLEAIEAGEAAVTAQAMRPTSERITEDVLEGPLGFGMFDTDESGAGGDDADAPGPIAALVDEADDAEEE